MTFSKLYYIISPYGLHRTICRLLKRHGITDSISKRERHGMWKGGRVLQGGYIRVLLNHDDPYSNMCDTQGYVPEHRYIMAKHLGRSLEKSETVHHKDGNTENNSLENLQLRSGRHGKGKVLYCLECGSHNIGSKDL